MLHSFFSEDALCDIENYGIESVEGNVKVVSKRCDVSFDMRLETAMRFLVH